MSIKNISFLSAFLLLSNIIFCQNKKVLVPYLKNNEWGLSNLDKKIVVTPKYNEITYINPYFLARKDSLIKVLNSEGKLIGSDFIFLTTIQPKNIYLFIKEAPIHNKSNTSGDYHLARYATSFYLYKLKNNKFSQLTNGTSDALLIENINTNRKTANLFFVTANNLTGVYDVQNEKYLINPKYKNFHIPEGNFIIAYNNENDLEVRNKNGSLLSQNTNYVNKNITKILDNGYYVTVPNGEDPKTSINYKRNLLTPEGKIVIKEGLNMRVLEVIDMIQCQIESTIKEHEKLYNYYDLQGNLLLSEIKEYQISSPNLLGIYGKGYNNLIGLYNYKTREMVWKNDFKENSKVKLEHHYDFGFSELDVDTTFYYFDDKGNNLMKVGGYNRHYNRYKKAKTIKITPPYNPEDPFKYRYLTALRNSEEKPFEIYNEKYQKVDNIQDFLGNSSTETYAFKENNKWKLGNFDGLVFKEQYDSITFTKTDFNFRLYKNGKSQIYLKKAKKLIPAFDYDEAIGYEHYNYYLGIKYLEKLKHWQDYRNYDQLKCKIDLIDSKGNIIYTFINTPEIGLKYALTKTNQIIEYPEDNKYFHFRIHNTKTKEIKDIKERILYLENYKDMPVVAILASDNIVDDNTRGLWNINKNEWLRTLTKESITYQSQEVEFTNNKEIVETLALIEIKDNPNYKQDFFFAEEPRRIRKIIGYISIDGTFFAE